MPSCNPDGVFCVHSSQVEVVDGGVMESRRHLNVRGKSATLPAITEKDWLDLKFGVEAGVDAFALSFVKVCHDLLLSCLAGGDESAAVMVSGPP
jgi:pyruvate kinase